MKTANMAARFLCGSVAAMLSTTVMAAGQVDSILVSEQGATPFSYSAGGVSYDWARGSNQLMEGFVADGRNFTYASSANEVVIQLDDIPSVAEGEPCGIFVERLSVSDQSRTFAADFPSDGSELGNCNLEFLLSSRIINRGLLDAFSNTRPDAKNIERIDYLFYYGALAPLRADQLNLAGHAIAEKSGNNPVKVAAILSVDIFGQPDEYGPLVLIGANGCVAPDICYGSTDLVHDYSFLQNEFISPQSFPVETGQTRENVNMAFVTTADLGLSPGQHYHGFSIFADDVDASIHTLTDPRSFPNDTSDDYIGTGDDADLYGGLTGYYLADELNVLRGAAFLDVDLDGVQDNDEAGLRDITVSLYEDVNNNGMFDPGIDIKLGDSLLTDTDGSFVFPGLPDGNYIVVIDGNDPQIPGGLEVAPGTNPVALTVSGTDTDPVSFAFVSDSGSGSGSNNDGSGDGDGSNGDGTGGNGGDGDGSNGDGTGGNGGDGDGSNGDGTGGNGGDDDGSNGDGTGGNGGDGGDGSNGTDNDDTNNNGGGFNDDATAAASDQYEINQGTSAQLDVLTNDTDGAGNGLTITSVSGSPNATVTISDDMQSIEYVPNAGYYSPDGEPDTFTYTVEDSDGTQSTGNVAVTVVRFSDLNNNLQNDFVECGCTDLFLETGVDGSGIGSVSSFLLFLIGLSGLARCLVAGNRKKVVFMGGRR